MNDTSKNAANMPVRRPAHELHTADVTLNQKAVIADRADLEGEVIVSEGSVTKDYADSLAMAEEPVTIRIERGSGKAPMPVVDCWVNGKGAEILVQGRWVSTGYLPVGRPITTKRKYVEVLAKSKLETVNTKVIQRTEDEDNLIERHASQFAPFSILEDKNPNSAEWFQRLVRAL